MITANSNIIQFQRRLINPPYDHWMQKQSLHESINILFLRLHWHYNVADGTNLGLQSYLSEPWNFSFTNLQHCV